MILMGRHEGDGTGPMKIVSTGRHADYSIIENADYPAIDNEEVIDGPDHHGWPIMLVVLMVTCVIGLIMIVGGKMVGSSSEEPVDKGPSSTVTETVTEPAVTVTRKIPGPTSVITKTVPSEPSPVPGPTVKIPVPGPTVTKTVTAPAKTKRVTAPAETVTKIIEVPAPAETVTECPAEVVDPLCP